MREILFRGKSLESKEWTYGLLFINSCGDSFVTYLDGWIPAHNDPDSGNSTIYDEVYSNTISQYIGRKDKNETNIFEGDIVKDSNEEIWTVSYSEERAMFNLRNKSSGVMDFLDVILLELELEIIGNIHDNPELLKGE